MALINRGLFLIDTILTIAYRVQVSIRGNLIDRVSAYSITLWAISI